MNILSKVSGLIKLVRDGVVSQLGNVAPATQNGQVVVYEQLLETVPYKVYSAYLNQSGTAAPTAVILQNTLGVVPMWSRAAKGVYEATATGIFVTNKTTVAITLYGLSSAFYYPLFSGAQNGDNNKIYVHSNQIEIATGIVTYEDSLLFDGYTFVEIRVYP